MRSRATGVALLAGLAVAMPSLADLSVEQAGSGFTVKSDLYAITFDSAKGGTITQVNGRRLEQKDAVGDYALASDKSASVTVKEGKADRLVLVIDAQYLRGAEKAPSEVIEIAPWGHTVIQDRHLMQWS